MAEDAVRLCAAAESKLFFITRYMIRRMSPFGAAALLAVLVSCAACPSCVSSEANRPPESIGCTSIGWNWRSVNMAGIVTCLCESIKRKWQTCPAWRSSLFQSQLQPAAWHSSTQSEPHCALVRLNECYLSQQMLVSMVTHGSTLVIGGNRW